MDTPNRPEQPFRADAFALINGQLAAEVDEGRALAQAIVDTVREPLLVLDKDLRVVTASRSFYLTFKLKPEDVHGRAIYLLGNGEWNIPELRALLENAAPLQRETEACEVEQSFSGIGRRTMLLNARRVAYEGISHATILAIEDVTDRRAALTARATIGADLRGSITRENTLRREIRDSAQRQLLMGQELDHRFVNGLQLISSVLSLQGRSAAPKATAQLTIARRRIAAFGHVHRRLHLLDHQVNVEFGGYLHALCDDLSSLLFEEQTGHAITVEATAAEIPTERAIPLGFILAELTTNALKHGAGRIAVRFETSTLGSYSLSVVDDGPGLPAGFDPAQSKGLGMKIVRALVQQIPGALHFAAGDHGRGARSTVTFDSQPRPTMTSLHVAPPGQATASGAS